MDEVGGALVAIALVLCAVFIPSAFITGISGAFYKQFALTIAASTIISAFVSLTLSPALAALLLRPHGGEEKPGIVATVARPFNLFFSAFNLGFERLSVGYAGLTRRLLSVSGSFRRIVQTAGGISMYYDVGQGQGWQRNIVMDGRPHLPSGIRQWFGDSRGHWEGNTLVVDVTNFSPKTDAFGSRENLHLIERWTRTGPTTLAYEATVEDPTVWPRPWTVKQEFSKQSDGGPDLYRTTLH